MTDPTPTQDTITARLERLAEWYEEPSYPREFAEGKKAIAADVRTILSERATLKAELEEARGVLEPFANERLSMEPTVSDCLLRSAGAEMRLAAEKLDARDNAIRAARAYLTKEPTNV